MGSFSDQRPHCSLFLVVGKVGLVPITHSGILGTTLPKLPRDIGCRGFQRRALMTEYLPPVLPVSQWVTIEAERARALGIALRLVCPGANIHGQAQDTSTSHRVRPQPLFERVDFDLIGRGDTVLLQ